VTYDASRGTARCRHYQGDDYYSTRLLSHFLLHWDTALKVAHRTP
jgi:hypothetical protein